MKSTECTEWKVSHKGVLYRSMIGADQFDVARIEDEGKIRRWEVFTPDGKYMRSIATGTAKTIAEAMRKADEALRAGA